MDRELFTRGRQKKSGCPVSCVVRGQTKPTGLCAMLAEGRDFYDEGLGLCHPFGICVGPDMRMRDGSTTHFQGNP